MGSNEDNLRILLSHISRLYNSTIGILATLFFGWIAFIGFILSNLKNNGMDQFQLKVITPLGIMVVISAWMFFYVRMLRLGRSITRIENDLKLRDYINELPPLEIQGRLSWLNLVFNRFEQITRRTNDDPRHWSPAEWFALVILTPFYGISIIILLWMVFC